MVGDFPAACSITWTQSSITWIYGNLYWPHSLRQRNISALCKSQALHSTPKCSSKRSRTTWANLPWKELGHRLSICSGSASLPAPAVGLVTSAVGSNRESSEAQLIAIISDFEPLKCPANRWPRAPEEHNTQQLVDDPDQISLSLLWLSSVLTRE